VFSASDSKNTGNKMLQYYLHGDEKYVSDDGVFKNINQTDQAVCTQLKPTLLLQSLWS
jgi:hypothetical protein